MAAILWSAHIHHGTPERHCCSPPWAVWSGSRAGSANCAALSPARPDYTIIRLCMHSCRRIRPDASPACLFAVQWTWRCSGPGGLVDLGVAKDAYVWPALHVHTRAQHAPTLWRGPCRQITRCGGTVSPTLHVQIRARYCPAM